MANIFQRRIAPGYAGGSLQDQLEEERRRQQAIVPPSPPPTPPTHPFAFVNNVAQNVQGLLQGAAQQQPAAAPRPLPSSGQIAGGTAEDRANIPTGPTGEVPESVRRQALGINPIAVDTSPMGAPPPVPVLRDPVTGKPNEKAYRSVGTPESPDWYNAVKDWEPRGAKRGFKNAMKAGLIGAAQAMATNPDNPLAAAAGGFGAGAIGATINPNFKNRLVRRQMLQNAGQDLGTQLGVAKEQAQIGALVRPPYHAPQFGTRTDEDGNVIQQKVNPQTGRFEDVVDPATGAPQVKTPVAKKRAVTIGDETFNLTEEQAATLKQRKASGDGRAPMKESRRNPDGTVSKFLSYDSGKTWTEIEALKDAAPPQSAAPDVAALNQPDIEEQQQLYNQDEAELNALSGAHATKHGLWKKQAREKYNAAVTEAAKAGGLKPNFKDFYEDEQNADDYFVGGEYEKGEARIKALQASMADHKLQLRQMHKESRTAQQKPQKRQAAASPSAARLDINKALEAATKYRGRPLTGPEEAAIRAKVDAINKTRQ